MPTPDPSSMIDAVHRIKEELDALVKQQSTVLQNAIYLGMTPMRINNATSAGKRSHSSCSISAT